MNFDGLKVFEVGNILNAKSRDIKRNVAQWKKEGKEIPEDWKIEIHNILIHLKKARWTGFSPSVKKDLAQHRKDIEKIVKEM